MAELAIDVTDWDVTAYPHEVILYLHQDGGSRVPVQVTPDQAAGMGIRLIQAAYVADTAVCTRPGSESALSRIDEVLSEHQAPARALGVSG